MSRTKLAACPSKEAGLAAFEAFVHSPVAIDATLRDALAALGPVEVVVAPCLFHHLSVAEWSKWEVDLEQVLFGAYPLENEVVFFHRASRTIISSDLIFDLSTVSSGLTRFVAKIIGNREPGSTFLERVAIRDRKGARAQIDRMIAWDATRIVLAYGDVVAANGAAVLERAYRWL